MSIDPKILESLRANDPTLKQLDLGAVALNHDDLQILDEALAHNNILFSLTLAIVADAKTAERFEMLKETVTRNVNLVYVKITGPLLWGVDARLEVEDKAKNNNKEARDLAYKLTHDKAVGAQELQAIWQRAGIIESFIKSNFNTSDEHMEALFSWVAKESDTNGIEYIPRMLQVFGVARSQAILEKNGKHISLEDFVSTSGVPTALGKEFAMSARRLELFNELSLEWQSLRQMRGYIHAMPEECQSSDSIPNLHVMTAKLAKRTTGQQGQGSAL